MNTYPLPQQTPIYTELLGNRSWHKYCEQDADGTWFFYDPYPVTCADQGSAWHHDEWAQTPR